MEKYNKFLTTAVTLKAPVCKGIGNEASCTFREGNPGDNIWATAISASKIP